MRVADITHETPTSADERQPADDEEMSFQSQGFLKLSLLTPSTCQELREYILQEFEHVLQLPAEESQMRFSAIRKRQNRWDLKLPACTTVRTAMQELLQCNNFFRTVLPNVCQCPAEEIILAEMGSLISHPGAPAQDWHADSLYRRQNDILACCFIALQETPRSMGPTEIIPHTHTHDFHKTAVNNFPPKGIMPSYVSPQSMQAGYAHAGEACLMDCRLYHRGGANTYHHRHEDDDNDDVERKNNDDDDDDNNDGKRLVFYFTVRSRNIQPPGGFLFTILEELNGMPLSDFLES